MGVEIAAFAESVTTGPLGGSGKPTSSKHNFAQANAIFVVRVEKRDGGSPLGGLPEDPGVNELKVLLPLLRSGMVESDDSIRLRIHRRDIHDATRWADSSSA